MKNTNYEASYVIFCSPYHFIPVRYKLFSLSILVSNTLHQPLLLDTKFHTHI
jgi:hypothetical protein